jgi:RNA polymerase sigma-70 factor (ECF subfamily)
LQAIAAHARNKSTYTDGSSNALMSRQQEDKELIARIATRDKSAMRQLYNAHHDALFAFLRSRGADPQAASDAIQDAMLDVWRIAERYNDSASVKTWIYTIARNKMIDTRRKNRHLQLSDEMPEEADSAPNPEVLTIAANDASRVRACLGSLKPALQTIMRLAFYEDLTYGEISEIEGIAVGTVKTRIFHAKKLLMHCLGRA